MSFMIRVHYRFQKFLISPFPSAIFRRTCPCAFNAYRILYALLARKYFLKFYRMLPIVAIIIDIVCLIIVVRKIFSYFLFPSREDFMVQYPFFIGKAYFFAPAMCRVYYLKMV